MTHPFHLPQQVPAAIFRAYDIRGIVNEALTEDVIYAIARAIASEAKATGNATIVMGRDGRLSGPLLSEALRQGLIDGSCDVIDVGMVPTPLLYFAAHQFGSRSGVMLTGSHNPADYNGLKIVIAGKTLAEDDIQRLYQRVIQRDFISGLGQYNKREIIADYLKKITVDIQLKRRLKVVVDCGNGVTGIIAPQLFQRLNCEVIPLYETVDGHFPHHHPDPIDPANLQDLIKTVQINQADIGLAFDGDGDRLGVVTNEGAIIWADRLLMLFAKNILQHHADAEILFDVKCTNRLTKLIQQEKGRPLMWKTGHSLIKAKMAERNILLAGEMSGHIFFKDRWYGFDDALYAAARLLEIVSAQTKTVHEIFLALPNGVNTPELKLFIADSEKFNFIDKLKKQAHFSDGEVSTVDGLRVDFAHGWGLVRSSNTTPCLIMRFEGDDEQALQQIQQQFRRQLLAIDSSLQLPF